MSGGAPRNLLIALKCLGRARELPDWCEHSRHARGGHERTGSRASAARAANSGHEQPRQPLHQRCVGCENQGRPGRSGTASVQHERRGNRRGRSPRRGAAAACERAAVRPEPQAVVRSTLPKARAEVSALVRARLHGVVRSAVNGEAVTGDARSVAAASRGDARSRRSRPGRARRGPRRVRRAAPARGDHGGPANDAVEPRRDGAGPATAVSAASRRASGARSDRRERRREGYPPEGPRPRSGLGRVARSRSDAPKLPERFGIRVTIIGTDMTASVCTSGVTNIFTIMTVGSISASTGSDSTNGGGMTCCGRRAAEPPRSAAPQATREAKASAGGGAAVVSDQKETGRAAG